MNQYQPHVYLNGRRLDESRTLLGITPLAEIRIDWGTSTWWDPFEPAQATIVLLDPFGRFLTDNHEGSQIRITRDDPVTGPDSVAVWDGEIARITTQRIGIADPVSGNSRHVWQVTLTAVDPLAAAVRDRSHGPKYPDDGGADSLHWGPQTGAERREAIETRSPAPIEWTSVTPWFDEGYPRAALAPYETSQNISLLTVLRNTVRTEDGALARPYYDPRQRKIRIMRPPSASSSVSHNIRLSSTEPELQGIYDTLLDGQHFEGAIAVSLTGTEQITHLTRSMRNLRRTRDEDDELQISIEEITEEHTAVSGAPSQTTWDVSDDLDPRADQDAARRWWVRHDLARLVANFYRRPRLEPFRWTPTPETADLAAVLLTPAPPIALNNQARVFFMRNNLRNQIPRSGLFVIGGGRLTYSSKKWVAECYPLPAFLDEGTPTLGDIVNSEPLADFDGLLVADLTQLTEG